MNISPIVETFGDKISLKKHIKLSEALEDNLKTILNDRKLTKQVIEQEPSLLLLKTVVNPVDLVEVLIGYTYLWSEMEFSPELRLVLVQSDTSTIRHLPDLESDTVLRTYIHDNAPYYLYCFGDLSMEELKALISDNGLVEDVTNIKELLLSDQALLNNQLLQDPSLLSIFNLSKDEEYEYLSKSFNSHKYSNSNFSIHKITSHTDPQYFTELESDTLYLHPIKISADELGNAFLTLKGDVIISAYNREKGIPIFLDENVTNLTISSEEPVKLALICASYCTPIGTPTCTGLSYGRWAPISKSSNLESVTLNNIELTITSSTPDLPLAGIYGESNSQITVNLNNSSVNGDYNYTQEGYEVILPYVDGSTKLSDPAQYTKSKFIQHNTIQGF